MKEQGKKSNNNVFLEESLERCNLRWAHLFWGIWSLLNEKDKEEQEIREKMVKGIIGMVGFQDTKYNVNSLPHNRTNNNLSILTFFF